MKEFNYLKYGTLSLIILGMVMISGCEKPTSTEDESSITYYVTFDLDGVNDFGETLVEVGSNYSDPGFTAMEGATDVTGDVEVSGTVDASTVGAYHITYNAINEDGFPASASRTVIVYDPSAPADDLTGSWSATVLRYIGEGTTGPFNTTISIRKVANGFYYISDWLAGFYSQGYGYGSVYNGAGYFTLSDEYQVNFIEGTVAPSAWNIPVDEVQNGSFDPQSNTLQQDVIWNGTWRFEQTLSKI